jgi:hypothetical protein
MGHLSVFQAKDEDCSGYRPAGIPGLRFSGSESAGNLLRGIVVKPGIFGEKAEAEQVNPLQKEAPASPDFVMDLFLPKLYLQRINYCFRLIFKRGGQRLLWLTADHLHAGYGFRTTVENSVGP